MARKRKNTTRAIVAATAKRKENPEITPDYNIRGQVSGPTKPAVPSGILTIKQRAKYQFRSPTNGSHANY
jgi:hypothetical protein